MVPTYGRRAFLPGLVAPLLADPGTHELVVVVDGSTDGSIELLNELARRDRRLIPILTPNRGQVAARLTGVARATGDVILILDDDVVAEPGLVSNHARHHVGHRDRVVVGYMPLATTDSVAARIYSRAYENHCRRWQAQPELVVRTLWGGNVSLGREAFLRTVHGPTRHRYDFHSDQAFSFRCAAAGLAGTFDRQARASHHYRRTLRKLARDAYQQGLDLVHLNDEFPEDAWPMGRDHFTHGLSSFQARLIEFCRRPRAGRATAWSFYWLSKWAGATRATRLEELAALSMVKIERQRGAIAATKDLRKARNAAAFA